MSRRASPHAFAAPDALQQIEDGTLLGLLQDQGGRWVAHERIAPLLRSPVDHAALSIALLAADPPCPNPLLHGLYRIRELGTPERQERLLGLFRSVCPAADHARPRTPIELAAAIWLQDAAAADRLHAESFATRPKNFEAYLGELGGKPDADVGKEALDALQRELAVWFGDHDRHRTAEVFPVDRDGQRWFLVRHGDPLRHFAQIDGEGKSTGGFFQPERYDVVIFDRKRNELLVHAQTRGEIGLYAAAVGEHLFGDRTRFRLLARHHLDEIRAQQAAITTCLDVDGLEEVRLVELQRRVGGVREVEVSRSADYFRRLERSGRTFPSGGTIIQATFELEFSGRPRPRRVTLTSGNRASYEREADQETVRAWLENRSILRAPTAQSIAPPGGLWRALAEVAPEVHTRLTWRSRLGGRWDLVERYLVPTPEAPSEHPCGHGDPACGMRISVTPDGLRFAVCRLPGEPCGHIPLGREDVVGLRLDSAALLRSLTGHLRLRGGMQRGVATGGIWTLGDWVVTDGAEVRVEYALPASEDLLWRGIAMAGSAMAGELRILLVPSLEDVSSTLLRAAADSDLWIQGLAESVTPGPDGTERLDLLDFLLLHRDRWPELNPEPFLGRSRQLVIDGEGGRCWYRGHRLKFPDRGYRATFLELVAAGEGRLVDRSALLEDLKRLGSTARDPRAALRGLKGDVEKVVGATLAAAGEQPEELFMAVEGEDDRRAGYRLAEDVMVRWWTRRKR